MLANQIILLACYTSLLPPNNVASGLLRVKPLVGPLLLFSPNYLTLVVVATCQRRVSRLRVGDDADYTCETRVCIWGAS